MASIERTAYPQFKRNPVVRELVAAYTPTDAELAFVGENTRQPAHRLTLTILLKTFQRLGYFHELLMGEDHGIPIVVFDLVKYLLSVAGRKIIRTRI